jgi:hypothetical protein
MNAAWQAIAQAPSPLLWDPRLLWLTLALAAAILIGVLLIAWIDRWRKRSGCERLSANEQLANFRELYEQGELNHEEFERIRATLSPQLRQELDGPMSSPEAVPKKGKPTEPEPRPD